MKVTKIDYSLSSDEPGLAKRYLILDNMTNIRFGAYFKAFHEKCMDLQKRDAFVQGTNIIVTCTLEELQYQVNLINSICEQATRAIQADMEQRRREAEEVNRREREQTTKAHAVFKSIKFE